MDYIVAECYNCQNLLKVEPPAENLEVDRTLPPDKVNKIGEDYRGVVCPACACRTLVTFKEKRKPRSKSKPVEPEAEAIE